MVIYYQILLLIVSYLLGSIPNALIVSEITKSIDIREYGSKNMGATNVFRVLGPASGVIVFLLDALKASIIILCFKVGLLDTNTFTLFHPVIYGIAALLGHLFPVFTKFKGGKGVACTCSIILLTSPAIFLITAASFILTFIWKRYVSLASLVSITISLIVSFWVPIDFKGTKDLYITIFLGVAMAAIFISHRSNIKRLITKKETRLRYQKEIIEQNNQEKK